MSIPSGQHQAKLITKTQLTAKFVIGRFALATSDSMTFVAGQHIMWQIAEGVNRSMSIASPPSKLPEFEICHDVSPMGPGSRWMVALKEGERVNFIGPLGIFTLDKASPRKKILIATGSGIAPFRAMIHDYLEGAWRSQVSLRESTDDVTLYWGLRFEEDIFWQEEFAVLSQKHPNFVFVLTLSQPTPNWQGKSGRVTAHLGELQNPTASDFYLCGNKDMVDEVQNHLLAKSVPKEQIKSELFY